MLFNEKDVLTLGEIEQSTSIIAQHLSPSLLSLCKTHDLLRKQNKNVKFDNLNETFSLNLNWSSQLLKIKTAPNEAQIKLFAPKDNDAVNEGAVLNGVHKERIMIL